LRGPGGSWVSSCDFEFDLDFDFDFVVVACSESFWNGEPPQQNPCAAGVNARQRDEQGPHTGYGRCAGRVRGLCGARAEAVRGTPRDFTALFRFHRSMRMP
jgi:hypothetical protein